MKLKLFRLTNKFGRRGSIDKALELFHRQNGQTIVEIGSICNPNPKAKIFDGHSTFAWALHGKKVFSVDCNEFAVNLTRKLLTDYNNVSVINSDGIKFLEEFNEPIDLLYLDAWDEISNCRTKHLSAFRAASKNLHVGSLILIDDAFSKASFLITEATSVGWHVVFNDYQVLLNFL